MIDPRAFAEFLGLLLIMSLALNGIMALACWQMSRSVLAAFTPPKNADDELAAYTYAAAERLRKLAVAAGDTQQERAA